MTTKRPDQYLALPCSGRLKLGNKRGHVYKIDNPNGTEVGVMTLNEAKEKYGDEKVFISSSDTLCPSCYESILDGVNELQKENRIN